MDYKAVDIAMGVIRATYKKDNWIFFKGGKESMVMLDIILELYDKIENPLLFLDNGKEQKELYEFLDMIEKKWKLDINRYDYTGDKVSAIYNAIRDNEIRTAYIAIRRDENPARKDEQYLTIKNGVVRIHPMLDFTEEGIWEYIREMDIPYCSLYDKGFRSIGDGAKPSTDSERSGRDQEKERIMNVLREMGYF